MVLILLLIGFKTFAISVPFKDFVPFRYTKGGKQIQADVQKAYFTAPVFVDWDEDGDLDLIQVGYSNPNITYLENIGTPQEHDFSSTIRKFKNNGVSIDLQKNG